MCCMSWKVTTKHVHVHAVAHVYEIYDVIYLEPNPGGF